MKKFGFILLVIMFLVYGYQGYEVVRKYKQDDIKVKTSGRLSDIVGKVASVPLETPDNGVVRQVRRVQTDGNHLFLISDLRLLQFDLSGKFVRQLTPSVSDGEVFFADYALDADHHLLIAIDSQRNICKFDYAGNLLSKTTLKQPWRKLTAFTYHNGYFWMSAEYLVKNADNPDSYQIVHSLFQFDADMNEIAGQRLHIADVGRFKIFESYFVDELLADEYGVYAYTSPNDMEHLLIDTLHIMHHEELPFMYKDGFFGAACIYPVRKGKRFQIATNYQSINDNYTFCFDRIDHTAYILQKGFKDNLQKTGYIADLQSIDIYNNSYCYIKSGASLSKKFPDRAKSNNNPVLFIVTLKG